MLEKFLKEAMNLIVGKIGDEIVSLLDTTKYVNEFLIAKKLNLTINQVRNILYKLSDHGLVSSIRKKDKRKGWYTYFWKIEVLRSLEFLRETLTKSIDEFQEHIKKRETNRFYVCERCDIEYNEESALLHNFMCEECGNVFVVKDNTKFLKESKKELEKLDKARSLIDEEIKKEKEKVDKKRQKEFKKEEIERKAKLKARGRKAKRAREARKKLEGKTKTPEKKSKKIKKKKKSDKIKKVKKKISSKKSKAKKRR